MFAANFLDYLPQPDDTRYFQTVAPSSNPVARTGRLYSLPKLRVISNLPVGCLSFHALLDNGDLSAREAAKAIDKLVDLGFQSRLPNNANRFPSSGLIPTAAANNK